MNKKVDSGGTASCTAELVITDALLKTYDGEMFLLEDTGADDPNRILIFCSTKNLETLDTTSDWYCDGTFAVSPKLFYQMFTINVIVKGKNLPLVYTLLPNKTEETYTRFFSLLCNSFYAV